MKFRIIPAILIAITLSIVTSEIVYFGFNSSYTRLIFSRQVFDNAFARDVYKYRILSKYLLLALDDQLSKSLPEKYTQMWIFKHNNNDSEHLYYAFFYLNTFFLALTSIVWAFLLYTKQLFKLSDSEKYLLLFFVPIIINLTQYVVCPYDTSSYFFQLLILYIFLIYFCQDHIFTMIVVCALLIVATLNRESSALIASALLVLLYKKSGISKKSVLSAILVILSFIIPYILLRHYIINPPGKSLVNTMAGDFSNGLNIMGGLFWGLFFVLSITIAVSKENRLIILFYHLMSLPYILVCLRDGVFWEVRLYIPLFLGSLLFSKLDQTDFKELSIDSKRLPKSREPIF